MAFVQFCVGQFDVAREHFEIALESPEHLRSWAGDTTPSVFPTVLLLLGYPAASLRKGRESLDSARLLPEFVSLARALTNEAMRQDLLRDCRAAMERADEVLALAAHHESMAFYEARATFCRGWAMATAQQEEDGIAEMRRSLSSFATGALVPLFLALLADCYARLGRDEEGLSAVTEGLTRAAETGERMAEAELYRVKGELVMMRDPPNEAEAERCFYTAIDIARRQEARWWELRATVSIARLLKRQAKRDEARAMLAPIYEWFTEGFEFADLKDAKALLDELGA
jgi:predicted ATPase